MVGDLKIHIAAMGSFSFFTGTGKDILAWCRKMKKKNQIQFFLCFIGECLSLSERRREWHN